MSLIPFPIRGVVVATVLCFFPFGEGPTFRADKSSDPFNADSVWKGELVYNKSDYCPESKPYVMILYIKRRKGAKFQGVTWYPTQQNGLLKVTGRISEKGNITFIEEEVIHGEATPKRNTGVVPGMKFTGQLDKMTIKGSGKWTGPAFNGEIRVRFLLKLAE